MSFTLGYTCGVCCHRIFLCIQSFCNPIYKCISGCDVDICNICFECCMSSTCYYTPLTCCAGCYTGCITDSIQKNVVPIIDT